ncbi:MAG: cytidine deaminase [Chloroflexota bacterium]|jgi:cytidine deaminase|nr:cytidine deaminase [Chloroflexota bacterium]
MSISAEQKKELVRIAKQVRKWAYVPYSKYPVGAALLTESGRIYEGVNVENAAFPVTNCAERTAIFTAVTNGEKDFQAIAVVTDNGGMPCGACRQVMAEFSPNMLVIVADEEENIVAEQKLSELLPGAFTPKDLK